MLSVNIHYSSDRLPQLKQVVAHLLENNLPKQIIVLVDGSPNFDLPVEVVVVPRTNGFFCRAKTWKVGVEQSLHDHILYLDSDRLVDDHFIEAASGVDGFLYPRWHRDRIKTERIDDYHHKHFSMAKNPMSGCLAFDKESFWKAPPDEQFLGWRFADADWFRSAMVTGVHFTKLASCDVHLPHAYPNKRLVKLMYLWNGIKYARKWGEPIPLGCQRVSAKTNVPLNEAKIIDLILKEDGGTDPTPSGPVSML